MSSGQRVEKPFRHADGLLRKAPKTSNSHSSAYTSTVECELCSKSKYLRSKPFGLDARRAYMSMPKPGFFLCHPERKRRILAQKKTKKILRHFVPQNDKGRGHSSILTVWTFIDSLTSLFKGLRFPTAKCPISK